MARAEPNATQERELGIIESALLWNWLLSRQGLAASTRFSSVVDISNATLGLHAARLPSPYTTVVARGKPPHLATHLFAADTRAHLITVRCMRKTLHTLPLKLATAAHAATRHFRERDAQRAITRAGQDMSTISATIEAITTMLGDDNLHHRTIETRLASPHRPVMVIRLALKLAWERGILTYINDTACWNKEHRTFAVTAHRYPELDTTVDRHTATRELITTYFDRYGPATINDAMWWSGLSRTAVLTAMHEASDEWIRLHTPWSTSPAYMSQSRWEEFADDPHTDTGRTGLNFLAHEDVAFKAYYETRSRYLGSLPAGQAFNQIGEVLPTIVWDGHVVGTWSWQPDKTVTYSLTGQTTPHQRNTIADHATTITDALRLGWSSTPHRLTDAQLTLL